MAQKYETLKKYSERIGLQYNTVWKHYKVGKIPGAFKYEGSVLVPIASEQGDNTTKNRAATYARVSSPQNKDNCETQSQRLYNYAVNSGYQVVKQVKEYASGLNEK